MTKQALRQAIDAGDLDKVRNIIVTADGGGNPIDLTILTASGLDALQYALIPPKGKAEVQVVDLGDAVTTELLIASYRQQISQAAASIAEHGEVDSERQLRETLTKLTNRLIRPIEPLIEKADNWLICPDGGLWLIPWAALMLKDEKYIVEKHNITHMISGRSLVGSPQSYPSQAPLVVANVDLRQHDRTRDHQAREDQQVVEQLLAHGLPVRVVRDDEDMSQRHHVWLPFRASSTNRSSRLRRRGTRLRTRPLASSVCCSARSATSSSANSSR